VLLGGGQNARPVSWGPAGRLTVAPQVLGPTPDWGSSGSLTLRHAAQGRCITEVVRAGHGFTELPGVVHGAGNQRQDPAAVYATFILPPGAPPSVSAPIPAACH
jgi:hypothetical protein